MDRKRYEDYVAAFNRRDYDLLHQDFFHQDIQIWTVGHVMDRQDGVRKFYNYFHEHVVEFIEIIKVAPYEGGLFAEIAIELTGKKDLTAAINAGHGFPDFPTVTKGMRCRSVLFVDYELKDGKFYRTRCAEYSRPEILEG